MNPKTLLQGILKGMHNMSIIVLPTFTQNMLKYDDILSINDFFEKVNRNNIPFFVIEDFCGQHSKVICVHVEM